VVISLHKIVNGVKTIMAEYNTNVQPAVNAFVPASANLATHLANTEIPVNATVVMDISVAGSGLGAAVDGTLVVTLRQE
jgi:hypothetical protein